MKEFYVQLSSHASTVEFPSNTANIFKNRLPYPLQFREAGWKVGMSSVSLPTAPRKIKLKDPFLFRFGWIELVDIDAVFYTDDLVEIRERDLAFTPKNGTEFMNMKRDRYLWALREQSVSDLQFFKKKSKVEDPTELLYMTMNRAENGHCVVTTREPAPPFGSTIDLGIRRWLFESSWPRK